jgi:hypothetical protein
VFYYSFVVLLVSTLSVMRWFPAEVLTTLTVFNAGFSIASVMLGYATVGIRYFTKNRGVTPNQPGLA